MAEKMTLGKLADKMEKGFQKTDRKTDEKIDQLALTVAKGFTGVDKRFDKVETRLDKLEQGQEEIKLKLDQVAYRFEVRELDRRLKLVEQKLGIAQT